MIRSHFLVASLSLLVLPLLDSAMKGTVVLLVASAACLLLLRDSAAARHQVWATAVLLLLAMPLLSMSLPQWRVLPSWSQTSLNAATPDRSSSQPAGLAQPAAMAQPRQLPENDVGDPGEVVSSSFTVPPRSEERPALPNETDFDPDQGLLAAMARQPEALLTTTWLAGCTVVVLRLLSAAFLLRKSASNCRVLAPLPADGVSAMHDHFTAEHALRVALDAAAARLNVKRSVQLLLDPRPSMPVVWGLWRCRLRLPAEAVHWNLQQQQSVLLHELAHIRRHDLVVLTMAQFACALNWFNPLMWFAAWRLGVERERACDDLVLASGVRPSDYAGHLLEVVTDLSSVGWTQSCGLAMARKSSLEGRLAAVLSENLNRRGVSVALTIIGLAVALGVAVPLAMLRVAEDKPAFPPPKPEAVRGLDLSAVAVRNYESAYRSLPDLYGPYSEKPWSGSYAKNVFQMPLAEHTWLKYPAGSGHFYIQHRHNGTPESEQIYGPIEGDPFDMLKLEELLREQMKPGATSGDPRYRLRLMFRNGEPGLVRRAWRMIEPELALKFTHRDETFYPRFELFEGVRDALRNQAEAFRNPELKDIIAQARQRVEAAEAEFDELNGFGNDAGDDDGYQSVTYLQPKIAAKIPDALWGKPLDGLRLGLTPRHWSPGTDWNELPADTELPTSITLEPGQEQGYQLVVENVSDHDIKLCGYFLGEERHRMLEVLDRDGKLVESQGLHTLTPSFPSCWRLKPGERHLLSMPSVHFMPAESNDSERGLGYFVKTAPGEYTLRCSYRFGLYDNSRHRYNPANGVWVGPLTTGSQRITFMDPGGAKDTSASAMLRQQSQKATDREKLPGRLVVNAGLRTTKDEKRFVQSAIAIDPNTGTWTRLLSISESGFTVPLSPLRVSPDGKTLLFMRENEIWKCDAMTGENPARVFPKGRPKAWAPDGKEFIAVVAEEAGKPQNWRVSADGKNQSLLSLPLGAVVEDWSADGRWLVGWSHADGQLYVMQPDGSGRRRLTSADRNASRNEHPRFSPNGRRIVYLRTLYESDNDEMLSRFSLRTINVDGTDDREILGETAVAPAPAKAAWTAPWGARWSPDGEHLAVVLFDHTRDGGILAINGNWRLAIIDADGRTLRELKLEGVLTTVLQGDAPEWRPLPPAVVSPSPPPLNIRLYSNKSGEWTGLRLGDDSKGATIDRLKKGLTEHVKVPPAEASVRIEADERIRHEFVRQVVEAVNRFGVTRIEIKNTPTPRSEGASTLRVRALDAQGKETDSVYINLWLKVPPDSEPLGERWRDGASVWERTRSWSPGYWKPDNGFKFSDIAAGEYRVTAVHHDQNKGGGPAPFGVSDVVRIEDRGEVDVTVNLRGGDPLVVRVLDAKTGEPVEYVGMRLFRADGMPIVGAASGTGNFFDRTDAKGELRYGSVPAGEYQLQVMEKRATAAWERPIDWQGLAQRQPIEVSAGRLNTVEVRLEPKPLDEAELDRRWPWSVRGRVTDASGRPMEGVEVRAHTGNGTLHNTGRTTTDKEGRYVLRFGPGIHVLRNGRWTAGFQAATISAHKPGYAEQNPGRDGNLAMADEPPAEELEGFRGVVLPGRPYALNFVLVKTAGTEQQDQPAAAPPVMKPKHESSQALFKKWQEHARADGKIPGGALGSLARAAANFVKFNPTHELAPKLAELLKRIDMSHDWTPAEAIQLLDEVTAVYDSLPAWALDEPRFTLGGAVQTGQRLPAELGSAPWGEAQPTGLRVAWLLDPPAEQYRLGAPLKSRILFNNAGKNTVVFRTLTWTQSAAHQARDAQGGDIQVTSTHWTTIPQIVACRLEPGEFLEVAAAGIGVGARTNDENWQNTRVGSWVEAKEGDEVTFTPAPVSAAGNHADERARGEPDWWLAFIKDRLSLDMPLPAAVGERRRLLDRAVRDLFGTAPTAEETAAFAADSAPDAFETLAKRLAVRAGTSLFTGTLQSGATKFRVLPVDPHAATKPRTANNPGRYTLGENIRLVVTRRPEGERLVNEASIVFFSSNPKAAPPGPPHSIKLPDGYNTWAAAWVRDSTALWVLQKDLLRRIDFADALKVEEIRFEADQTVDAPIPPDIRESLRDSLAAPDMPKQG